MNHRALEELLWLIWKRGVELFYTENPTWPIFSCNKAPKSCIEALVSLGVSDLQT